MRSPPLSSAQTSSPALPSPPPASRLRDHLAQAAERLVPIIRTRLLSAGLAKDAELTEQARDVFQETVLEALRSEAVYDPARGDLDLWVFAIAMNVVRRRVERFGVARRRMAPEPGIDPEAVEALHERLISIRGPNETSRERISETSSPEQVLSHRQEVNEILSHLSERHQEVLRLYYLEHDQDNEAVADAMKISPGNARVLRHRALEATGKRSSR